MKKLFHHTKRPARKWDGYDESGLDWDEPDQGAAYREVPEGAGEDDDGMYAGTEYAQAYGAVAADGNMEEWGEPEAAEYAAAGDAGEYRDNQEGLVFEAAESGGEYGWQEEGYLASVGVNGDAPQEEGEYPEALYGDAPQEEGEYPEEPYGDTPYGDGIYEDGTYGDGAYADAEDDADAPYGSVRSPGGRKVSAKDRAGRKGKGPGKSAGGPVREKMMDRLLLGTGAAVLILAVATGGVYLFSRSRVKQVSSFSSVGTQLDHIDMIGETGLLAVADAQLSRLAAADIVDDSRLEQEEGGSQDPDYQEEEYKREVHVVMEFVSIQKDLKIKFVNEKTGKLVANVPFSVNVTDPDGKSLIWSDDDMDGVIYKKDIAPGNYKVVMEALADQRYAGYSISSAARTAEVKKEIAYQKVEVANEIKNEDEVNAEKEDTKKNETQVESALQDTVGWVESSVIDAIYSEVPKSSIPNPMMLALDKDFVRTLQTSGGDVQLPKLTVTLDMAAVSVMQGGTVYPQAHVQGADPGKTLQYSIAPSSSQFASASIDAGGKITVKGIAPGTTRFTVTVNYAKDGTEKTAGTAVLDVTVTAGQALVLDKNAATAYVGEPLILNATVSGAASPVIKAVSSDETVATAAVSNTVITVTGKKAGTVNLTVSLEANGVKAEAVCIVTVKENPKTDTVSLLKDADGQQLYVLENDKYREAVYADYYVETNKFYLRTQERYTGWQTLDGKVYYFTADGEKVVGEQVIQGAKYQFASDGSLVTGTGALGIDVSKWNGNIDWGEVKKSGINYVIIRCGYRGSSAGSLIVDPKFTANIKGATAAGLKVGVYFFTQAIDEREAVEEASMVLELVKNYTISYPIFLDVESSGGRADAIDKTTRTAVCRAFCQTIQNAHYTAGIYANKNWLENKIDAGALGAYKIWLAQYAESPTYTGRYDMWQYRATGTVGGISGNVDMNLSYLGY